MSRDEVLNVMRDCAVDLLKIDPAKVTEEATFAEDLEADSLDVVELVMALEEKLDISIPEEDLEGIKTVGEALDVIAAKVA
ncbi:MAG TPA: acyl carrier protein [Acidimicrobiales bacterium]|nr:acyl carrier protein [Acidimicrobiales bacterium]